jgi:hypothetical protein
VTILKHTYGKFKAPDNLAEDSNPTEVEFELSLESVDRGRKIFCRRQTECVTFAASQNWTAFSCRACQIAENLSVMEIHSDLDGLAQLLAAINLG